MKKYQRIMKKILLALLLTLTMIFGTCGLNAYAEHELRTVKVGYFEFNGYHELNERGERSGYGYDFLKLLQRYANLHYEYVGYYNSWEDMKRMLLNGEIDMVTSARKMPEREQLYAYSRPIGINYAQITARPDDYRFYIHNEDYSSLNGAKIGVLKGSSRIENLYELAAKHGFTFQMVEYTSEGELTRALKNGNVDLLATSSLRKYEHEKVLLKFAPEEFYVLVRKEDKALLDEINYGIEQMDLNEGDWSSKLYYKNYASQVNKNLNFTQRELDYIADVKAGRKKIIATVQTDRKPYSYIDNGKLQGIIPEYFAYLMQMAGLPYETMLSYSRAQYLQYLYDKKANVYMSGRDLDLEGITEGINSESYMKLNIARVTRKDFKGQIHSAAVVQGKRFRLEDNMAPDLRWEEQPTREGVLNAVALGLVDAGYVYNYTAYEYVREHPDSNLSYTTLNTPVHDLHVYVTEQTDHELASIINKCIKADGGHKLDEIIRQKLVYDVPVISLRQFVEKNPMYVAIALFIIAVVVYIFYLNTHMRRNAQQLAKTRLQYAEELQSKNAELEASMAAEKQANMAKRQFLFNMSHDIRTPMNAILGFAELAKKHLDEREKLLDYLQKITRSGDNLLALINNVLEMSRIETGKQKLHEEICDGREMIKSILVSFEAEVKKKNISLEVESSFQHSKFWMDQTFVRQIIVNLLSNAIKYTPAGGTVRYTIRELPHERPGWCYVQAVVSDNGIGISKEFLPHIFEQFEREQTTTTGRVEGSGLGMAIVKRMLDMMNAKISITSEQGKGTTVTTLFEHRYVDCAPEECAAAQKNKQASLQGVRVLLAEDNDLNAEIAMTVLGEAGMLVERAKNGEECVELVQNAETPYDVVLMDVQMPLLNGYDATRRIRALADATKRSLPIIAMTANAFAEDKEKALEAGMNDFLPKPVDVQKMLALLAKVLQQ